MKLIHKALLAAIASSVASSSLAADHHSSSVTRKLSSKAGDGKNDCSDRPLHERMAVGFALQGVAISIIAMYSEEGSIALDHAAPGFAMLCAGAVRQNSPNAAEQEADFMQALIEADAAGNSNGEIDYVELAQVLWNSLGDCVTFEQVAAWYPISAQYKMRGSGVVH